MAKKYKLTGCAKFFIFFIIAAPIAYVGASYYNGNDPIKPVIEFFQSLSSDDGDKVISKNNKSSDSNGSVYQEMELKNLEIKALKNDLDDCESMKDKQKEIIETQKKEIKYLKQQAGGSSQ